MRLGWLVGNGVIAQVITQDVAHAVSGVQNLFRLADQGVMPAPACTKAIGDQKEFGIVPQGLALMA